MTPTAVKPHSPVDDDTFGVSNAASARAIAEDDSVAISADSEALAFTLGLTRPQPRLIDIKGPSARGFSDAIALVAAHHDHTLHNRLQPQGHLQQQMFNEMERARCESLGGRKFAGSAFNTATLWQQQHDERLAACRTDADRILLAITTLTRDVLSINPDSLQSPPSIAAISKSLFEEHRSTWQQLATSTTSQRRFAETSKQIIATVNAVPTSGGDEKNNGVISDEPPEQTTEPPDESSDETSDDDTLSVSLREEDEQSSGDLVSIDSADTENADASANRDAPVTTESEGGSAGVQNDTAGYRVFSTANDEVVRAGDLCHPDELVVLRDLLDQHIHRHSRVIGKLSGKLQRVLMAQQTRQWEFNLSEGMLDTARLTRVVTQPLAPLAFKQESDSNFKDTSITLLVDNSKSMLGKPVAIAAACADILSQTLERCGVSVEILGFTTTELHRGPAYEQWQQQGGGEQPGRLNGLRHIIYKPADTPYRRCRMNFGVMLMKDLLKQNIDGESLLWAHNRLIRRPERRKILIVISDGAPIDTSTMAANPQNYLVDHLHQVIHSIETTSEVELLAIGIGHDVTAFYQRAMKIMDVKDLSASLLSHMSELFNSAR